MTIPWAFQFGVQVIRSGIMFNKKKKKDDTIGTTPAARFLKVYPATVKRWAESGKIKGELRESGNRKSWRFKVGDLLGFMHKKQGD